MPSRPVRPPPRLATLIALSALSTLSLNLFLPSLAAIGDEFATDYALVKLSIAGTGADAASSAGGLLGTMLCCSLLALLSALDVRRTEAREAVAGQS